MIFPALQEFALHSTQYPLQIETNEANRTGMLNWFAFDVVFIWNFLLFYMVITKNSLCFKRLLSSDWCYCNISLFLCMWGGGGKWGTAMCLLMLKCWFLKGNCAVLLNKSFWCPLWGHRNVECYRRAWIEPEQNAHIKAGSRWERRRSGGWRSSQNNTALRWILSVWKVYTSSHISTHSIIAKKCSR